MALHKVSEVKSATSTHLPLFSSPSSLSCFHGYILVHSPAHSSSKTYSCIFWLFCSVTFVLSKENILIKYHTNLLKDRSCVCQTDMWVEMTQ